MFFRVFNDSKVIRFYSGLNHLKTGQLKYDYGDGRGMIKVNNKYCLIVNIENT